MSQVPSSTRTAYTTPTYADGSKNSNTQSKPASTGTSLSASDVTVSRQAYSQAKFDSYETMDRNSLKKKGKRSTNPTLFSQGNQWLNRWHEPSTATRLRTLPPYAPQAST